MKNTSASWMWLNFFDEALATALFIFVGCFVLVAGGVSGGALSSAIAFTGAFAVVALAFGGIHRVQMNPGLSLALYLSKLPLDDGVDWARRPDKHLVFPWLFLKWIGQLLGGFIGAYVALLLLRDRPPSVSLEVDLPLNGWGLEFGSRFMSLSSFFVELFGATLIIFVALKCIKSLGSATSTIATVSAAGFITHLLAYPATGASLNFARTFGPKVATVVDYILDGGEDVGEHLWSMVIEFSFFGFLAVAAAIAATSIFVTRRHDGGNDE